MLEVMGGGVMIVKVSAMPSYFFFWAFSAAFVTLPEERSLKFTLCKKIRKTQNINFKNIGISRLTLINLNLL